MIPYVDMGPELEGERPAAAADFDKMAETLYNEEASTKGLKRRYKDLSPSTRLRYYYRAQKKYEKLTGKPAYEQVRGNRDFEEYLKKQPERFQRQWLGPLRYKAWKNGKIKLRDLTNPDTGYKLTLPEMVREIAKNGKDQEFLNKITSLLTKKDSYEKMEQNWPQELYNLVREERKIGSVEPRKIHRETQIKYGESPIEGIPNSSLDIYRNDVLCTRRFFDQNGNADYDIDYDHRKENHEFPHRHYWFGKERSRPVPKEKEDKDDRHIQ